MNSIILCANLKMFLNDTERNNFLVLQTVGHSVYCLASRMLLLQSWDPLVCISYSSANGAVATPFRGTGSAEWEPRDLKASLLLKLPQMLLRIKTSL